MNITLYSTIQCASPGVVNFPEMSRHIKAAFSWGPSAGNMAFSHGDSEEVKARLNGFLQRAKMPPLEGCLTMIAENNVQCVDVGPEFLSRNLPTDRGRSVQADAIFTTEHTPVLVKPADCTVSILLGQTRNSKQVLGVVHAGFRGADLGIGQLAVDHLEKRYGIAPQTLRVAISPSIARESYFIQRKEELSSPEKWAPYISEANGKFYLDTLGHLLRQYTRCGVPPGQIEAFTVDTYRAAASSELFSERYFRLHPNFTNGRMVIAAQLTN